MVNLKLALKSDKNNTERNKIKKKFIFEIKKERTYRGMPLAYANEYISEDECWLKFVAGSVHHNPSRVPVSLRVRSVCWTFDILDILFKVDYNPSVKYTNLSFVKLIYSHRHEEIIYEDSKGVFHIYLEKVYAESVNGEEPLHTGYFIATSVYKLKSRP